MGPDLKGMLETCEGALLIGDRALEGAKNHPEMVQLDLAKITIFTQKPMAFGVFATQKDTPIEMVREAHGVLANL